MDEDTSFVFMDDLVFVGKCSVLRRFSRGENENENENALVLFLVLNEVASE